MAFREVESPHDLTYEFNLEPDYWTNRELRKNAEQIAENYNEELGRDIEMLDVQSGVLNIVDYLMHGEKSTGEITQEVTGNNNQLSKL